MFGIREIWDLGLRTIECRVSFLRFTWPNSLRIEDSRFRVQGFRVSCLLLLEKSSYIRKGELQHGKIPEVAGII